MRPAEFSPEEIVAAGEALVAAGRNVTGFALRQKVGGGNPNRLKQVWDEHLAAKNTTEAEPVAELPVEVLEFEELEFELLDELDELELDLVATGVGAWVVAGVAAEVAVELGEALGAEVGAALAVVPFVSGAALLVPTDPVDPEALKLSLVEVLARPAW